MLINQDLNKVISYCISILCLSFLASHFLPQVNSYLKKWAALGACSPGGCSLPLQESHLHSPITVAELELKQRKALDLTGKGVREVLGVLPRKGLN